MINFKKMDEKDFVFINTPISDVEDKAFSEFLKKRKIKTQHTKKPNSVKVFQNK